MSGAANGVSRRNAVVVRGLSGASGRGGADHPVTNGMHPSATQKDSRASGRPHRRLDPHTRSEKVQPLVVVVGLRPAAVQHPQLQAAVDDRFHPAGSARKLLS